MSDSEDAFERHMAVLLAMLEEVRGRTAKPHGPDSRSILKLCAFSYHMDEKQTRVPTADVIKPLLKLRKALSATCWRRP